MQVSARSGACSHERLSCACTQCAMHGLPLAGWREADSHKKLKKVSFRTGVFPNRQFQHTLTMAHTLISSVQASGCSRLQVAVLQQMCLHVCMHEHGHLLASSPFVCDLLLCIGIQLSFRTKQHPLFIERCLLDIEAILVRNCATKGHFTTKARSM